MTNLQDLLALPDDARLRHRLTKKEIAGQYEDDAPTDARYLTRTIAQATIVGVLRPETIGVRAFQGADRRADFVPVLDLVLADKAGLRDAIRVADLMHRSMPRPVVMQVTLSDGVQQLAVAVTRLSRTDSGGETSVVEASLIVPVSGIPAGALSVSHLNRTDLWALYSDIVRIVAADGRPASAALTAIEAIGLRRRLTDLGSELDAAVRDAKREKNIQRQIDLNASAARLRRTIAETHSVLYAPKDQKHDEESTTR